MSKLSRSRQKRVLDVPPSLSGCPSVNEKLHQKEVSSPVAEMNILMELYGCKQEEGETVRVFAARLNQIAASFPLANLCDCGCNHLVSYASETVLQLLLCGLHDKELQSMCLLEAQNGRAKNESTLIEFCDGLESAGNMEKICQRKWIQWRVDKKKQNMPAKKRTV